VRGQADPNADPYTTLGLQPGASMAEVKRAYRVLAKAFHPDSAGEGATPRFLAIQDAYERLRTGRAGPAGSVPRSQRAPSPPPREPWRADPARARAARERARTARNGSATNGPGSGGPASGGPSTGTSASGSAGGRAGRSGTSGTAGPGPASAGGRGGRRATRKATMGSTSYDEARDVNDPTWSGASWYGPSSGEYWIVNPREYADPRKHGPEYQQRARRPRADLDPPPGREGVPADQPVAAADATDPSVLSEMRGAGPRGARRPQAAAWTQAPGAAPRASRQSATSWSSRPGEATREGAAGDAFASMSQRWIGGPADDPVRRLGLALVTWPPIGLAAAVAIGEVTGCTAYAAACTGAEPMLPWLAQAVILGLLLLLSPITRLLVGGSIAVLVALVPVTAFLVAVGGAGAPQAAGVMAVLLAAAWVVGVVWSVVSARRRGPASTVP
jgi:DnaJ domain